VRTRQTVAHSAATLRASLIGKTVTQFSCDRVDGPQVPVGSAVEQVDHSGKHVEIMFDDGLILHTVPQRRGRWELFHVDRRPRRLGSYNVIIETNDWVAVAYKMKTVETYRTPDPLRHPRAGRRGPDLRERLADLHEASSRLFHYSDPHVVVADAMMDPRVMVGVGNVLRCEVLWACGIHPWAPIGELAESTCLDVVMTTAGMVRALHDDPTSSGSVAGHDGLAVYGRNGQLCSRCAGIIRLSKHGESERLLFWCPGCQVAFEPASVADDSDPVARATDPHPAASQYLREIFSRRSA
jgi:endonuclease VIII